MIDPIDWPLPHFFHYCRPQICVPRPRIEPGTFRTRVDSFTYETTLVGHFLVREYIDHIGSIAGSARPYLCQSVKTMKDSGNQVLLNLNKKLKWQKIKNKEQICPIKTHCSVRKTRQSHTFERRVIKIVRKRYGGLHKCPTVLKNSADEQPKQHEQHVGTYREGSYVSFCTLFTDVTVC